MCTLLLIDANALIHRAFHALPPLTSPDGEPIGAIYGLANTLLKTLKVQKPDYIAAAFDRPEPTFRKEEFPEYKAHRPKAADELISQIIKARELFLKFQIPIFERPGFEADDIIGSLVKTFKKEKELQVVILTGDLDTLQLIEDERIIVRTPQKGITETIIYDEAAVMKRYGLKPSQIPDYKGLVGDPSDNIPGVPGVGPKSAEKILSEFKNLETALKEISDETPLGKKILTHKIQAALSKKLATIHCDMDFGIKLENIKYSGPDFKTLTRYFTELGFQSLVQRLLNQESLPGLTESAPLAEALPKSAIVIPDTEFFEKNLNEISRAETKIAFDWKTILKDSKRNNFGATGLFDLKIAGWLLDSTQKDYSLESLTKRFLRRNFDGKTRSEILTELFLFFEKKIKEYELSFVFKKIEMPLIEILADMENWGIRVNKNALRDLKSEIDKEIENLVYKIYKEAGTEFNINSPKQVGEIIFERLKIGALKYRKTKGGQKSTAEKVLFELKDSHPIINLILEYRENFKIKSTYVEPLLKLAGKDGLIHTTFIQTGTATGRLSSEKPNLQNIPQESKWSSALRKTFEAENGRSFLSFDYSQLELRLLAHISGDKKLIEAFRNDEDIHRVTASQVFNVPLNNVDAQMRRLGKTLNFGVVYGMGAKAFGETSGLSLPEAQKFIKEYFDDFPAIKIWQEKTKSEAKSLGFVKNLNGRRRWFLNTLTGERQADYEIERAAINMPVQSLNADILKLAMIEVYKLLKEKKWLGKEIKILLTIHDELLFEIDDAILKEAVPVIKNAMEKIYDISVPLKVEVKIGKNWGDIKKYEIK